MAGKGVWATETCSFIRKLFKPLNYKKKKKKQKCPQRTRENILSKVEAILQYWRTPIFQMQLEKIIQVSNQMKAII